MKTKVLSVVAAIMFTSISLQAQTLSTFAGSGVNGFVDGPALTAQFSGLEQMVYDKKGNLLICDASNHRIRKIDAAGNVTTFAGTGTAGFVNGNVGTAQFNNPLGIAVDNFNNIYISDNSNFVIRKIDNLGKVTTYAGTGDKGFVNGSSSSAQFDYLNYMCFDKAMNLYVADPGNNMIRKIDSQGNVSTFVGSGKTGFADGIGASADLSFPIAIAYDKSNDVFYVSDQGNSVIRKVLPDGTMSTYAGSGVIGHSDGPGTVAQFYFPKGLTVDNVGNVYVAGRFDYTVRKIDTQGNVSTVAGIPHITGNVNGTSAVAIFGKPIDVIMSLDGNLLVSDWVNRVIRKIELPIVASVNNKLQQEIGIQVSPNPFSTSTTIKINGNKGKEKIDFLMYDLTGKEIEVKSSVSTQQIVIERGDLPNGIYFYKISQNTNIIGTGKLIVE
ncbi:MAG: T9SS type A sorting domain-containing protein [Bacteroidota bacterium]